MTDAELLLDGGHEALIDSLARDGASPRGRRRRPSRSGRGPSAAAVRRALVRAAAAHRTQPALDWLSAIVADADSRTAAAALETLAAFRHDGKLAAALKAALGRRADRALLGKYAELWGSES